MNAARRRPRVSVEEFLTWENRKEERWEFDGFEPRAMVGGTIAHNVIIGNLYVGLRERLQGRCRVYAEGVRLERDIVAAEVYAREDDRWVRSTVTGDGILLMPEIGVELPLAEAYAGLGLDAEPG
jgi:hypothetical protein